MIVRRDFLASVAALAAATTLRAPAFAQAYPTRPIRMILPLPPGGPIDTMGRMVASELTNRLGQQVIIDNRAGAGSTLGTKLAAAAAPDGYTLLFGSSGSLAVAPALYQGLDIDPLKAFTPVARVALLPHVFIVANELPVTTVKEFVDYAKAHPGELNYGAPLGTPPHLLSTLFVSKAGIDAVFVPYKGSANSVTDLLAGRVQFTIDALITLYPLIKAGKVRALAIARGERCPTCPRWSKAASPISRWTPGPASRRPPARRPISSPSSTRRSMRGSSPRPARPRSPSSARSRRPARRRIFTNSSPARCRAGPRW